jgi:hypothetical protein
MLAHQGTPWMDAFLSIQQVCIPLLFAAGILLPLLLAVILHWREKQPGYRARRDQEWRQAALFWLPRLFLELRQIPLADLEAGLIQHENAFTFTSETLRVELEVGYTNARAVVPATRLIERPGQRPLGIGEQQLC